MRILIISAFVILASCRKEVSKPAACGFVFDKFYQSPPGDTSTPLRTYWLRVASDTNILPPPAPGITNWVIQVPKNIYDTMLRSGKNAVLYCY